MDVDAVLLDMDGTLVDSTRVVEAMWTEFADRFGVPAAELLAFAHGRRTRDTVERYLPAGLDVDEETARFQAAELVRVEGIVEVPGSRRLLDALHGAPVAVVTSAPRALAERRLTAAGLPVPDVLVGGEDVRVGKPDPAGYLRAARRLDVVPWRCVAFEDAEAGVRAALAAGTAVVVVGQREISTSLRVQRVPDLRAVDVAVRDDGTVQVECRFTTDGRSCRDVAEP